MMLTITKKQAHDSKKEKQQKKAPKRVQRQTASEKGKEKKGKSARQLA